MWKMIVENPKTTISAVVTAGLTIALIVHAIDVQGFCVALGAAATVLGLSAADGNK